MLPVQSLLRIGVAGVGLALLALDLSRRGRGAALRKGLAALAAGNLLFQLFLIVSHARFPFALDVMEFPVLQHVDRLLRHQFVYTPPAPDFVALAYNPLYYVAALPFVWIFGQDLFALRLLSILGMLGCMAVLFAAVRDRTGSAWWGLMAAGLFAAGYRAMDAYLDTAHCDSWLLLSALLGTWVLDRRRSLAGGMAGMLLLVAAFWFKQHGAWFALGGAAYLTLRDGWRRAVPAWLVLIVLGPVLYVVGGPVLFGPEFLDYTLHAPGKWSVYEAQGPLRTLSYLVKWYGALAAVGLWALAHEGRERGRKLSAWHFQWIPALATGFMGALDTGSSNNVFIPMGVWTILVGTLGLAALGERFRRAREWRIEQTGLLLSFVLLVYNPHHMVLSARAGAAYRDLLAILRPLPGTVYAPWIGQLPRDYRFWPAAHWVAIEDLMGRRETGEEPVSRDVLAPALEPEGPAWLLTNARLETYRCLRRLHGVYVLERDFGGRFADLQGLPKRWNHAWPRYLYRYRSSRPDRPAAPR